MIYKVRIVAGDHTLFNASVDQGDFEAVMTDYSAEAKAALRRGQMVQVSVQDDSGRTGSIARRRIPIGDN